MPIDSDLLKTLGKIGEATATAPCFWNGKPSAVAVNTDWVVFASKSIGKRWISGPLRSATITAGSGPDRYQFTVYGESVEIEFVNAVEGRAFLAEFVARKQARPHLHGATASAAGAMSPRKTAGPASGLHSAGVFVCVLAVLAGIGAVVVGVALITHTVCGTNPYDTSLTDCQFSSSHPFGGAGVGVLIGGLVQTAFLIVVAQLCFIVDRMREAAAATKTTDH